MSESPDLPDTTSPTGLIAGLALGLPVIAYGVRGALIDATLTHPIELATWVVGLAVLDDLVIIPATIAVGWLLSRVVPASAWPPVRAALLSSAVLAAVAWPLIRGFGRDPTNPSLLARNYATGLAAALVVVWSLALLWIAISHWRRGARLIRRRCTRVREDVLDRP